MEGRGIGLLRGGIDLVDRDDEGLPSAAQQASQFFVERREASLAVYDEDEQRGLVDGHARLAQDFLGNQRLVVGKDAARIHDFQRAAAPVGFAIDAVAGDAGLVGDNRAARTGQAVEERRLAHIGPSHDDERWKARSHEFGLRCNLPLYRIGGWAESQAGLRNEVARTSSDLRDGR